MTLDRKEPSIVTNFAIVVSFDSFSANSIGCYGNEWIETPNFDQLAATGIVFDRHFVETVGRKAGMTWADGGIQSSLVATSQSHSIGYVMNAAGIHSRLITVLDEQEWQRRAEFSAVQRVQGNVSPDAKPDEVSFACIVQAAIESWREFETDSHDRLLWLHAPGPGVPPHGFDDLYFEDFEERGQSIAEFSEIERDQHPAVYAGSVSLFDHWLGVLMEQLCTDITDQRLLLIVTSLRGYPWQKMNSIGAGAIRSNILGDQISRPPLLMKIIGDSRLAEHASSRSSRLVQSCDLLPTLLDWFELDTSIRNTLENEPNPTPGIQITETVRPRTGRSLFQEMTASVAPRTSVCFDDGADLVAVRTEDWLCIRSSPAESELDCQLVQDGKSSAPSNDVPVSTSISLFSKPEDIWDVDDVASQYPEVVAELLELFPQRVRH